MDLAWDDKRTRKFVSNVGLITSKGPNGNDIMSAEWTDHISYGPSMMAVFIKPDHASHKNISESKEFGISLAAVDQAEIASVAGSSTGAEIDKIEALKELGFSFYDAKMIEALMVEGAAMNAECKVVEQMDLGDHTMFVGEVQDISSNDDKNPLIYHNGKFFGLGEKLPSPSQEERDKIAEIIEKHKK